jgi:hypothetical protein
MMSGISGMSGMGGMGGMKRPDPQEMFRRDDADGSGGIDQEELTAVAEKMAEKSGMSIDAEGLMAEFDADEDGTLNEEEMKSAMGSVNEQMGPPPKGGGQGGPPPMGGPMGMGGPPPSEASAMYSQNSTDETSELTQLLESLAESEEEDEDGSDLTQQWLNALQGNDDRYTPIDALI